MAGGDYRTDVAIGHRSSSTTLPFPELTPTHPPWKSTRESRGTMCGIGHDRGLQVTLLLLFNRLVFIWPAAPSTNSQVQPSSLSLNPFLCSRSPRYRGFPHGLTFSNFAARCEASHKPMSCCSGSTTGMASSPTWTFVCFILCGVMVCKPGVLD
jgi:hypothetical protein